MSRMAQAITALASGREPDKVALEAAFAR
jgi:hypothetical protein